MFQSEDKCFIHWKKKLQFFFYFNNNFKKNYTLIYYWYKNEINDFKFMIFITFLRKNNKAPEKVFISKATIKSTM